MRQYECDSRITSIEKLDRSRCVMADAHSLRVIAVELEDESVPTIMPRQLVTTVGGPWLANVIHTIVLHDIVVVDSALFDLDEVSQAYRLFPDIIKGLFIRNSVREHVSDRVDIAAPKWIDRPSKMAIEDWNRWLLLDSSEKPLMDEIHESEPRLIPEEYITDPEIIARQMRQKPLKRVGGRFLNSEMTVGRAHFYLELARELRLPLRIDPVRSAYLETILGSSGKAFLGSAADAVIENFAAAIIDEDEISPTVFDVDIPPVAEYVLRYAQRHRISLRTATLDVRNSKNAKIFRDWCARLFALGDDGGLRAKVEYTKMMKDFKKACEAWAADVGEGLDFQTRKITLGDIPLVGKILKAADMSELVVKDPVIRPNSYYRYFIFLNDLLRQPTDRPA